MTSSAPPRSFKVISTASNTVIDSVAVDPLCNPLSLAYLFIPVPERLTLSGATRENRFLTQTDSVNQLFWSLTGDSTGISYQVFRGTELTAEIIQDSPVEFEDHNVRSGRTLTYTVVVLENGTAIEEKSVTIVR